MLAKYKAQHEVVLYAHIGARYDANLILEGLVRSADLLDKKVKFLKSSGGYISLSLHDKLFVFRDSYKFLNSGLRALAEDFKLQTGKGDYPHEWMMASTWSEQPQAYKPPRCMFKVLAEHALGPMKHRPTTTMAEADYAALPGLDPMLPVTVGALKQRMQLLPTPVLSEAARALVQRAVEAERGRAAAVAAGEADADALASERLWRRRAAEQAERAEAELSAAQARTRPPPPRRPPRLPPRRPARRR